MKPIRDLALISVVMLYPAFLWAATPSPTPDTVPSSVAGQAVSDGNQDDQRPVEGMLSGEPSGIIVAQGSEAEAREAQETEPNEHNNGAEEESPRIADPIAPVNKVMYHFNDKLYFWAIKPVTQVYAHIIPEDFRIAVGNFYDNLWAPSRVLNNLFQLRFKAAGNELIRFVFNSFAGLGGLGDVSRDALGIKKQEADFGQTLGHYGMGHGFYLVLPVFGPSSVREGIGLAGDTFMHPLTYVNKHHLTFWQKVGFFAHEKVNATSFKIGDYESFKESAIDPYVAMRDAFVQHRKKVVDDSKQ